MKANYLERNVRSWALSLRKSLAIGRPMTASYLFKCNLLKLCAPFLVKGISDSIQTLQARV